MSVSGVAWVEEGGTTSLIKDLETLENHDHDVEEQYKSCEDEKWIIINP